MRCGVSTAYGIELDEVKCQKASSFIPRVINRLLGQDIRMAECVWKIVCLEIEQVGMVWGSPSWDVLTPCGCPLLNNTLACLSCTGPLPRARDARVCLLAGVH